VRRAAYSRSSLWASVAPMRAQYITPRDGSPGAPPYLDSGRNGGPQALDATAEGRVLDLGNEDRRRVERPLVAEIRA
jgi:hypothetical protein